MNERTKRFLDDLRDLLVTHGVELEATDHYPGYPECGEDIQIEAYASPDWINDGTGQSIDVKLGSSIDEESLKKLLDSESA